MFFMGILGEIGEPRKTWFFFIPIIQYKKGGGFVREHWSETVGFFTLKKVFLANVTIHPILGHRFLSWHGSRVFKHPFFVGTRFFDKETSPQGLADSGPQTSKHHRYQHEKIGRQRLSNGNFDSPT